jgi:hypothetical protein
MKTLLGPDLLHSLAHRSRVSVTSLAKNPLVHFFACSCPAAAAADTGYRPFIHHHRHIRKLQCSSRFPSTKWCSLGQPGTAAAVRQMEPADEATAASSIPDAEAQRLQHILAFRRTHPELSAPFAEDDNAVAQSIRQQPTADAAGTAPAQQLKLEVGPSVPFSLHNYLCSLQPMLQCKRLLNTTGHPSDEPPLYKPKDLPPETKELRLIVLNPCHSSMRSSDKHSTRFIPSSDLQGGDFSLIHQRMNGPDVLLPHKQMGSSRSRRTGSSSSSKFTTSVPASMNINLHLRSSSSRHNGSRYSRQ